MVVSYEGVPRGVPVLTRDGEQFGILEHVLEVPELDVFDGIVVFVGGSPQTEQALERELGRGSGPGPFAQAKINRIEAYHRGDLRFVDADKVATITVGYIRCDLDKSEVGLLQPPANDSPAFYANAIDQAKRHEFFGRMFGRAHWRRE
jgi:hypothetical protein